VDQFGQITAHNASASDSSPNFKSSNPSIIQSDKNTLAMYLNPMQSSTDQEGPGAYLSNDPANPALTQEASYQNDKHSVQQVATVDDASLKFVLHRNSSSQSQAATRNMPGSQMSLQPAATTSQPTITEQSTRREDNEDEAQRQSEQPTHQ